MDIAGPVWTEKDKPYIPKGATGFGVRLIVNLLGDWKNIKRVNRLKGKGEWVNRLIG